MQTDENKYQHRPVSALPKSLIEQEGNTVAVIALMQRQAGLNRERRREMQGGTKSNGLPAHPTVKSISKTDWSVLTFYLSPGDRWGSFWHVVRKMLRRQSAAGTRAYAVAVDLQLLNAYEPGWSDLTLDAESLVSVCLEWPRIRERIEEFWSRDGNEPMPLGVFMLWPRLVQDLERWQLLDEGQRRRVGHAVFALSSIGWTTWFIDDALSRCPELGPELGELKSPATQFPGSPPETSQDDAINEATEDKPQDDGKSMESIKDLDSEWVRLGDELLQIHSDWQAAPSRALLGRLSALGQRATELLPLVPDDTVPARDEFERALHELDKRLQEAAEGDELPWLGSDDLQRIMARWRIALLEAKDDDAVLALANDAGVALDRLNASIGEVRSADAHFSQTKAAVATLEVESAQRVSAVRRIELSRRLLEAKQEALAAERKHNDVLLFVLASASPRGEVFDLGVDYDAELVARSNGRQESLDVHAVSEVDAADDARLDGPPVLPTTPVPAPESASDDDEGSALIALAEPEVTSGTTLEAAQAPESSPRVDRTSDQSVNAQPAESISTDATPEATPTSPSQTARRSNFSTDAGDKCRPVWTLLRMGKPALAYQYSLALRASSTELVVPPQDLLRSVALAPGLVAGDGPLAMSIGEAFADIRPEWFEPGDTPSNWHTALNLLLIAATLRPMILAPAMGAAAVVGFRHLDGRHSALLELVRMVEDVSEDLTNVAIGPTVLRSAADEASQKSQLAKLSKDAEDWLYERAPNKKIRYAPASKVWLHWLKPGEAIHRLVSPVARGAVAERAAVRTAIDELSDYNAFFERLRDTDRRQLQRRGQDIEAGALEHLWVATCEAVSLSKGWLGVASLLSDSGGRLRSLVGRLQAAFNSHAEQACAELSCHWDGDEWGQVDAASQLLRGEIVAIASMFKQSEAVAPPESQAKELLARDLLWVPGMSVASDWTVETDTQSLLKALEAWSEKPVLAADAFESRVQAGDLAGAELLLPHLLGSGDESSRTQEIERARDLWVKDLQREVLLARRASEVGLAYGYLTDAERATCESELSAVELSQRETGRFDQALLHVRNVARRIEEYKARRIEAARREFDREKAGLSEEVAQQVEAPLSRSDVHTFNELLQRVRQGVEPWPDRELRRDAFREFFPKLQTELLGQIAKLDAAEVDKLIRSGGSVGQLSFDLDGDGQARSESEETYRAWATSFSRRGMTRESLRKVLEALGLPIRSLDQDRLGSGWTLQTSLIDDREVCPVPHFGSRAQGRYRVVVLVDRLTPEDLLQRIGENTQQTATIVFALSRTPLRFWPDLARVSKERQRSFLLLDESILLFLLAQRGSRLATWFDIALPFTYSEPYDASAGVVPPEMFYGRASELEGVKAQGGCYFIYGGRQLGKTALLRRAEKTFHDPSADRYAVWVDLLAQGIGERRPAADVWLSVFDKLRELKIPGLELPSVNTAKPASIDAFLAAIRVFLAGKPGRRILLLLDEADHFFEQDARQGSAYAETRRLKQLMDETERRFKVVFAGLHNVLRTASTSNQPLGHLNEAVRIGPLMDEREIRSAEDLITRPIEAAGFEFEDRSLVMRVLAQTNYYPSLIQLYCTQLLRHLRESKLRRRDGVGPRFKIDENDIELVFAGRPLRDAIRSKFRLTLQLDDRYEVIANAIGLEALEPGYDHVQGVDWRVIRQDCSTSWWREGFATTSERDFLALLEEMVQLGVLSQSKTAERFSLRNPNVLLLLGSKQEIESTLQAEREPRIEFESTIFRPALGGRMDDPARNPLTYRQLDEVVQMRSSVLLVAASEAAGGANLLAGLRDQPGATDSRLFVQLDRATDKRTFTQELDKEIKKRVSDGITVMLVPTTVPWDSEWVVAARAKLNALKSVTSFVSVVFAADPHRLWTLAAGVADRAQWVEPWLSVLPWSRGFVRKWLEELQFPTDAVDRLDSLTGYWGGLLESAARVKGGALDFANSLDRMAKLVDDAEWRRETRMRLTGGVEEAERVLTAMQGLGDGVTEADLAEFGELSPDLVGRTLRWAEPLGLIVRQAGGAWAMDGFTKRMFEGVGQ